MQWDRKHRSRQARKGKPCQTDAEKEGIQPTAQRNNGTHTIARFGFRVDSWVWPPPNRFPTGACSTVFNRATTDFSAVAFLFVSWPSKAQSPSALKPVHAAAKKARYIGSPPTLEMSEAYLKLGASH